METPKEAKPADQAPVEKPAAKVEETQTEQKSPRAGRDGDFDGRGFSTRRSDSGRLP